MTVSGTERGPFDFKSINAIIFDYGGTLDTAGRHWSFVLREGYEASGVFLNEEQWKDAYVFGERALAKNRIVMPQDNFRDVLLKKIDKEFVCLEENGHFNPEKKERSHLIGQIADYCYCYALRHVDISREVLEILSKKYPLVLVSNFYGNIHAVLDDFRLNFFNDVIESSVVKVRKPDPEIFRLGLNALGTAAAETLVIGDSYSKDIIPASAGGCPTVWIRGEGWGKDPDDISIPKRIITDVRQLLPLMI